MKGRQDFHYFILLNYLYYLDILYVSPMALRTAHTSDYTVRTDTLSTGQPLGSSLSSAIYSVHVVLGQ